MYDTAKRMMYAASTEALFAAAENALPGEARKAVLQRQPERIRQWQRKARAASSPPRCYSRAVNRAYCLNLKGNDHGYYSIY